MDQALVSVIIPVYNRENVILRAISSVLTQSYENIEVIVVDDASSDNTARVVAQVDDPRLRIIRRCSNYGAAAARNVGIGASVGQYLAFLDSDDYWLPDKIRQQV